MTKSEHMPFIYDDGGRKETGRKGTAGDCVCRSIAIATGRSYDDVYRELAEGNGAQRRSTRAGKRARSARAGINVTRKWFKDYMRERFEWVDNGDRDGLYGSFGSR